MGKGKGKGFSRIAKLVTASARDQQASPQQVTILMMLMVLVTLMMLVVQKDKVLLRVSVFIVHTLAYIHD